MPELKTTTVESTTAIPATPKKTASGLSIRRFFTKPGVSPYDELEWDLRLAQITDAKGAVIFEQKDVEVPKDWSMTATNIVASKYLHGKVGTPERETGVRQLVTRVAETIRNWGLAQGYFKTPEDGATFHDELVHILVRQYAAFNSPVWFNVGCDRIEPNSDARNWHWNTQTQQVEFGVTGYKTPQCSACFINSVKDSLDSILTLAKTEGMLFKWGSGTGTNLSPLRSSTESLSGGGTASGPLSFMKGFDAFAGVIKSGGKTRRAAKMVILNVDHPDIVEFIECKQKEEAKAHALVSLGYDGSHPDSDAYSSIFFQNANNSVRVTDDFMYAVVRDTDFSTKAISDSAVMKTYKAKDLLHRISEATWHCGDPGMQYDTTVNRWHTSKNTAQAEAVAPVTVTRVLSYAKATTMMATLKKFLSSRGDIFSDERSNQLIIRDIPSVIPTIDNLIRQLDRKSQQVEIEARVISASRSFSEDIGVQWGMAGTTTSGRTIFGGPSSVGVSPVQTGTGIPSPPLVGTPSSSTSGGSTTPGLPLNVNLPAGVPTSGFYFGHRSANFAVDLFITAAEAKGVGKLLSKPKVITQNNQKATVKQGTKIPIQTTINNTISVQYIDAVLKLEVTPQITAEGTVFMDVLVENTQVDNGIPRIQGIPALDTQSAETKVLVADGGTVVIGGIIVTQQQNNVNQVPILGSLPLIGHLFRENSVSVQSQELLFFLTPRIIPG